MGRSHKDRDVPPIKNTTLRPLLVDDSSGEMQGRHPEVGHGEPLDNEGASENTGLGVVLNQWPADDRKSGEGPDAPIGHAGGTPNAKP